MSSVLSFFNLSPSPTDNFWYSTVGSKTAAGVAVNETTAMNYSVCWAATRLLAGTTGWLPLNLYRRFAGGGAEIASAHLVHKLIHDSPNPDMGSMMFRARGVNHQVNWGNCFAEIVRDGALRPVELAPIHPSRIPAQNVKRENGKLVYYVNQPSGQAVRIPQRDMFHVPSIISDDGVYGKGVVTAAREAIGKAVATQTHGASSMRNPVPPIVIKNGKFTSEDARTDFRRQWKDLHGTPDSAGMPALLPINAEVQQLGFNLKDSQFIESQQFDIEEVARWYGVPPHMVGHLLRSTFSNIEHQGIEFVKYSLMPWLKLWEQEIKRKLLTEDEQADYYAKFVVDALERGDKASRTEANVKEFFNGMLTLNQWAEREDMNPIGPLGDVHFVQQAMIPLELAAKGPAKPEQPGAPPPNEPPDEPDDDEPTLAAKIGELLATNQQATAQLIADLRAELTTVVDAPSAAELEAVKANQKQLASAMLRDVMSRMISLEVNAVKRVAEKASKFDVRLREFYDKHRETMARALDNPTDAYRAAGGSVPGGIVTDHIAESLRQLESLTDCTAEELPAKVESCVATWHERTVLT